MIALSRGLSRALPARNSFGEIHGFPHSKGHYNFIDYHRLSYLDYCIYIWGGMNANIYADDLYNNGHSE